MHVNIRGMTLAIVELPQLPLLLLLNLHVHKNVHKSCAGAAAAVVLRLPDDAICCCGLLQLIVVFTFLYSNTIYLNVPIWQCGCM